MTTKKGLLLLLFIAVFSNFSFAENASSLKGRVISMSTNRGMKEVPITISLKDTAIDFTAKAVSDAKGVYEFKDIPFGHYTLMVDNQEFHYKKFDFEVTPTHTPDMTFQLSKNVTWMFDWGKVERKVDKEGNVSYHHPTSHLVARIVLAIYGGCLILIFFYALIQFSLAVTYARSKKNKNPEQPLDFDGHYAPKVTIQLPMYN